MKFLTTVLGFYFVLSCLTKISKANDCVGKVMMDRIESWQSKMVNQKCLNQLNEWYDLLKAGPDMAGDNWAWRMLDAWDKVNPGLLTGNYFGLGQMDECLAIDEQYDGMIIKGQYCVSGFYNSKAVIPPRSLSNQTGIFEDNINGDLNRTAVSLPVTMALSICIPHECKWIEISSTTSSDVGINTCQTKDSQEKWDDGDWAFIIFITVIGVLVVTSTCYDWYLRCHEKKTIHAILLAFSFYTNGEKLLKISNNSEQFQSLNGIRAISMMWVLVGHRFLVAAVIPNVNSEAREIWLKSPKSLYVTGAPVAVDSFLFVTGIVIANSFLKSQCKPNASFNILLYYIHRYLRLTPAVGVLYFFYITLNKNISSGPMWQIYSQLERKKCLDNVLGYFLYMQNIINQTSTCLGHTWYLSVDMQLFIISPLILLPMVKYQRYAGYGLVVLVILSILPPALVTYFNDIVQFSDNYMKVYYIQPYNRMGPWLVGLLLGYICYQLRNKNIKINWVVNLCMWTIVLVGMFLILWFSPEMRSTEDVSAFALYNGFHRLCWALGLMWITFACEYGYGGFASWFLKLPIFQVWARISYSMYLLHIIQFMAVYRKKAPIFYDHYDIVNESLGDLCIVSALAFFYCMLFEMPIFVIESVLLGPNVNIIKGVDIIMNKLVCGNKKGNKTAVEQNEKELSLENKTENCLA